MMFPNKTFFWPRHIAIAFILLTFINLLVIFAPNILGIFGVIGRLNQPSNKGWYKNFKKNYLNGKKNPEHPEFIDLFLHLQYIFTDQNI